MEVEELDKEAEQDNGFYRQACYNYFLSVEIETIKQLIFLSSGGIGLLATLFLSSRFDSGYMPFWFGAVFLFLSVIIINLVLFSKTNKILKNEILGEDNSKNNKCVSILEVLGKFLFTFAILSTILFVASTKYELVSKDQLSEVVVMVKESEKKVKELEEKVDQAIEKKSGDTKRVFRQDGDNIFHRTGRIYTGDSLPDMSLSEISELNPKKKKKKNNK